MPKAYFSRLDAGYQDAIHKAFDYMGIRIAPQERISIKPNLTYPSFRKGVMTNPEAIEALVCYLRNYTSRIVICESDSGGYNPFSITEVFKATGIDDFARKHQVRLVNMSYEPARDIQFRYRMRQFVVPLPRLLLDETDRFITMPVPKIHMNTIVSLALKNQWGVIQSPAMRLKLHPYFEEVVYHVNRHMPNPLAVVDGKYGLTRSGPMRGDVVEMNWLLMCDSLWHTDLLVSQMMGMNWRRIHYLRHIFRREHVKSCSEVQKNTDLPSYSDFYLKRAWTDYPGLFTFKSRMLAYLGYESILARPLHWLLYKFRDPFY
jgi:uncharacterized protein (DUF362 family)